MALFSTFAFKLSNYTKVLVCVSVHVYSCVCVGGLCGGHYGDSCVYVCVCSHLLLVSVIFYQDL